MRFWVRVDKIIRVRNSVNITRMSRLVRPVLEIDPCESGSKTLTYFLGLVDSQTNRVIGCTQQRTRTFFESNLAALYFLNRSL